MPSLVPSLRPGQRGVAVVGAGFAGLQAAKTLARDPRLQVVILDERNHHLFQPMLYQVATAGLNPSDIAVPIRSEFAGMPNVTVHRVRITQVDLQGKWLETESGARFIYDYLILAGGSRHKYFGRPEWETFAPGLKSLEQATEILRRILSAFERAENEADTDEQANLLTFVIVGGGPTGVELAGAISDISRTVLVRDFRRITPSSARIILTEAGPRVLAAFDKNLSQHALRDLEALGVEVRLGARVTDVDEHGVNLGAEHIEARTVLWAAGVEATPLSRHLGAEVDRAGRVRVGPDLSIPGHPDAFVVGDMAHAESGGQVVPTLAPAAIQMGRAAARNVIASLDEKPREAFRYHDKGIMATIGRRHAIAQAGRVRLTGLIAWSAWLAVHIFSLIGFRRRVRVLLEWAWNYGFSQRGARLITERDWRLDAKLPSTKGLSTRSEPPAAYPH